MPCMGPSFTGVCSRVFHEKHGIFCVHAGLSPSLAFRGAPPQLLPEERRRALIVFLGVGRHGVRAHVYLRFGVSQGGWPGSCIAGILMHMRDLSCPSCPGSPYRVSCPSVAPGVHAQVPPHGQACMHLGTPPKPHTWPSRSEQFWTLLCLTFSRDPGQLCVERHFGQSNFCIQIAHFPCGVHLLCLLPGRKVADTRMPNRLNPVRRTPFCIIAGLCRHTNFEDIQLPNCSIRVRRARFSSFSLLCRRAKFA